MEGGRVNVPGGYFPGVNGRTVVIVTHDERVAAHCKRIVRLRDGVVVSDGVPAAHLDAHEELCKLGPAPGEVAG